MHGHPVWGVSCAPSATHRERVGRVEQLLLQRGDMVGVHVRVPQHDDKLAGVQTGDVSQQPREQRVRGDVEGHPQAHVRAALHHLAGQLALRHIELRVHVPRVSVQVPGG